MVRTQACPSMPTRHPNSFVFVSSLAHSEPPDDMPSSRASARFRCCTCLTWTAFAFFGIAIISLSAYLGEKGQARIPAETYRGLTSALVVSFIGFICSVVSLIVICSTPMWCYNCINSICSGCFRLCCFCRQLRYTKSPTSEERYKNPLAGEFDSNEDDQVPDNTQQQPTIANPRVPVVTSALLASPSAAVSSSSSAHRLPPDHAIVAEDDPSKTEV